MLTVEAIPALKDNYIWLIRKENSHDCVIVDPGASQVVCRYLAEHDLNLHSILVTHHHRDHTGGMLALKAQYNCPIYGPQNDRIDGLDVKLSEGDTITIDPLEMPLQVLEVPGHTLGHIVYFNDELLFCGDTLFAAGCGRLFEGTAEQLFHSLARLSALPDATRVYCTHEYTLDNLAFAKTVEPNNADISQRYATVKIMRERGEITLPSTIVLEKLTNPFLRCASVDRFAEIRRLKDQF